MLTYDPRSISSKVYTKLSSLKAKTPNQAEHKEQKSQVVELYNYVATWGLLRLKAEEFALSQQSKQDVVTCFFETMGELVFPNQPNPFLKKSGLDYLTKLDTYEYLGLTGLAIQVAREFAFWAEAIYPELKKKSNLPSDK